MIEIRTLDDLPPYTQKLDKKIDVHLVEQSGPLLHKVEIPVQGQYLFDFKLCSHPVLTSENQVYAIHNSVNRVVLTVGKLHTVVPVKKSVKKFNGAPQVVYRLDLPLLDRPLISGALHRSTVSLQIYFNDVPHVDYWIEYSVGYLDNQAIRDDMERSTIKQVLKLNSKKEHIVTYNSGEIVECV